MTAPAAVLAIDGGNSKTDVALVAADGTLLALARGPGSCPQDVGFDGCLAILADLVNGVAAQLGLAAGRDSGPPRAEHTEAYLACADLPIERQRLQRAVHGRQWSRHTHVGNDTLALLRAGTRHRWGVAVVCGAGINCVGVAPDGRTTGFPSLGRISGDWGGGIFLGEEVLWWAVRGEDGRGMRTGLQEAVAAHFALGSVAELSEALHLGRIPPGRLNELTPVLFAVATTGDRVARDLVDRLAEEIAVLATVALLRLDVVGEPADVVLGGGVLIARDPALMRGIEERLAAAAPLARLRITTVPPVVGAALLGLDRCGSAPEAESRLRGFFAEPAHR
jgi:N-acetylglucosamine kinase-like BadF-type ATPase